MLATKFGMPMDDVGVKIGGSRRYIMQAVEDSLRRLRTDWIDLYQIHQPDPRTPIEETLRALDDLVRQGKVRYIGCSNFPAWQVVEAQWTAQANGLNAFVSCQDEYSLLVRNAVEPQLRPAMLQYGMGLLPFFPLASGLLTGKYRRNAPLPSGTRLANTAAAGGPLSDRTQLADRGAAGRFRRTARPHAAGTRVQLAAGAGAGRQRDRRRDAAGTVGAECEGRGMGAVGGGTGGGRSHHGGMTGRFDHCLRCHCALTTGAAGGGQHAMTGFAAPLAVTGTRRPGNRLPPARPARQFAPHERNHHHRPAGRPATSRLPPAPPPH